MGGGKGECLSVAPGSRVAIAFLLTRAKGHGAGGDRLSRRVGPDGDASRGPGSCLWRRVGSPSRRREAPRFSPHAPDARVKLLIAHIGS